MADGVDIPTNADPRLVRVGTSFAALADTSPVVRKPRAAWRPRPTAFWAAFEDKALCYDAFCDAGGEDILLLGPAPLNLLHGLQGAAYTARPSGKTLAATLFPSRSTMITRLAGAPTGTTGVTVEAFGQTFDLTVQPNLSERFAGAKILFAINKDNRLDWIADWAHWHAALHGTDAVIVFDNGSTTYDAADIEAALLAVPGLRHIAVVPVPHKFGPIDKSVLMTRFYPRFLQISVTNIALRRFGMRAAGLINCDIDELAWAGGQSLYTLARQSELGAIRMRGRWIEAVRAPDVPARHLSFAQRYRDARHKLSPSKWVLDPTRDWVRDLTVQPYLHRIHGAPEAARTHDGAAMFFHFKGINTNWKLDRTAPPGMAKQNQVQKLVNDPDLALASQTFRTALKDPLPHA